MSSSLREQSLPPILPSTRFSLAPCQVVIRDVATIPSEVSALLHSFHISYLVLCRRSPVRPLLLRHLKLLSNAASLGPSPIALTGALLKPLRSPLPVLLNAWLIVSMFSSLAASGELVPGRGGLPAAAR